MNIPLQSGRTVGKMRRGKTARPSSERRPLRAKIQLRPIGKDRFPNGKYHDMVDAVE